MSRIPSSIPISSDLSLGDFASKNLNSAIILKIDYQLDCDDGQNLSTGYVRLRQRDLRFNLLKSLSETEVLLGLGRELQEESIEVFLDHEEAQRSCQVLRLSPRYERVDISEVNPFSLALKHAPVLSVRYDLYDQPFEDTPLLMGYTLNRRTPPDGASFEIVYQVVFADQNTSKTDLKSLRGQVSRWSRRSDIEWVYRVAFDDQGKVVFRKTLHPIRVGSKHVDLKGVPWLDFVNPSRFCSETTFRWLFICSSFVL